MKPILAAAGGICLVLMTACQSASSKVEKAEAPAKVSGPKVKESDLATVTLTDEAESRLGIHTEKVLAAGASGQREFTGDLMLPPGRSLTVAAPISGTVHMAGPAGIGSSLAKDQALLSIAPLLPLPRDLRVTAEADVEQARTRVETAKLRMARAERMLKDEVGTVRAVEEARNELDLAQSALSAADARLAQIKRAPLDGDVRVEVRAPQAGMLRQLWVAPNQGVNAGAPLFEVADLSSLWIRVPVYAGEAAQLTPGATAAVASLGGTALGAAHPIAAPPTADPLAATVDLYFEIANPGLRLKPGEKLLVRLAGKGAGVFLQAPFSAIVYDTQGGTWIYEALGERRYARRRVDFHHSSGRAAFLRSGVAAGTSVVAQGAAELWGTEFGAGK